MSTNLWNTVFSTFDLKWTYHQVPLQQTKKKFMAFEANEKVYQYHRISFDVTNWIAVFQQEMDKLIQEQTLKDTFSYLDNISVAGRNQEKYDWNVKRFLTVVKAKNLTLNETQTESSVPALNILCHWVGNGITKPDPERLGPLQRLPMPTTLNSLRRAVHMFASYAKWILRFSDKM